MPRVAGEPADHDSETGPIPRVDRTDAGVAGRGDGTDGTDGTEDADRAGDAEEPGRRPTLLEQMGGVSGIVASTVPVAVFVVANVLFELKPALIAAVVAGVLVALFRVARRQPVQPAVSGLFGVAVCAFIAYRTGEARGFYLPGLLYSAALGLAFLVSIVVRWPLAGVIWNAVNGHGQGWRRNPRMLRAYTWASALWALVFASRLVVQGWLYNADEETWLGIARLAMGYPLLGLAIVGTVVAVRRAERAPTAG
ncbi:DUF3159 domain-containing protein [Pseudonocardia lutea]|jgi:hypothetical protein|uniref:DUF3159 domain-containing protein n=1 Tax=Pseudonocardia lutea TaxID=2172015 RepID=A0ABW1IFP4_9PSEU